jgi:hypothetical protein
MNDDFTLEEQEKLIRRAVMAEIDALERSQLRTMREFTLGRGTQASLRARLEEIDDQIAALRSQLTP